MTDEKKYVNSNKEQSGTKYIDHLKEDEVIKGQEWVCLSFVSPEGIKNCSVRGLKIRGVYAKKEEADKRANELRDIDPDFHVFVGEVGKWLPWDPDPNSANEQNYMEKELNDLVKGYKENLERAKKMQQQRKSDMIQNAALEEQAKTGKGRADAVKDRLRKKFDAKKNQEKMDKLAKLALEPAAMTEKEKELVNLETELKKDDDKLKQERENLIEAEKQINEKTQSVKEIDNKLAKIQELYKKVNNKK